METESVRLEFLGLTQRTYQIPMVARMVGPDASPQETAAILNLVQALEFVKDYSREAMATQKPTSQTPLTRVVDAVSPESETSRRFSATVDQFVASSCKDEGKAAELRRQLTEWARNEETVQAVARRSYIVRDAAPASTALSQGAELALSALDRISQSLPLTDDLKKQQIDALNAFENQAHQSQLTLPARAAFQKLIEAVAVGGPCAASR